MNRTSVWAGLTIVAATAAWSGVTSSGHDKAGAMVTIHRSDGLKWQDGPPSLPPGAKVAVLEGDPTKEGPYVMRAKLPDGYRIPPHTHPRTERLTVMSGTLLLEMGEKFDPSKTEEMPAGSYAALPAGMRHFASAKGETVLQVHGDGPFTIEYVNPADDPRNTKK